MAADEGLGTVVESFLPEAWAERREPALAAAGG
jgi:hypothetical protein